MGSTRLPGKTLIDICGKPLLAHIIQRVQRSAYVDHIVVATTTDPEDLPILTLAKRLCVTSFTGNAADVLDRFYRAAVYSAAEVLVRVTGDDPFKDPTVMDKAIAYFLAHQSLDYVSNTLVPTFPDGLDVEVFSFDALECAWRDARLPSEREHVTPYIWKNEGRFKIANITHHEDLSHLRWTLDYEEDLRFARAVYSRLYRGDVFPMEEVLDLLQAYPELAQLNHGIARNEGYSRSLLQEAMPEQSPGSLTSSRRRLSQNEGNDA